MVSCSHAWYLYDGRWAPVECDLCWGRVVLIQSFLFECQINFMNHNTCPDCRLMILHYTLLCSVNCWVRTKSLHFSPPPPREDRYLFSFDMFILIIQFPSGCCSLLCLVSLLPQLPLLVLGVFTRNMNNTKKMNKWGMLETSCNAQGAILKKGGGWYRPSP